MDKISLFNRNSPVQYVFLECWTRLHVCVFPNFSVSSWLTLCGRWSRRRFDIDFVIKEWAQLFEHENIKENKIYKLHPKKESSPTLVITDKLCAGSAQISCSWRSFKFEEDGEEESRAINYLSKSSCGRDWKADRFSVPTLTIAIKKINKLSVYSKTRCRCCFVITFFSKVIYFAKNKIFFLTKEIKLFRPRSRIC